MITGKTEMIDRVITREEEKKQSIDPKTIVGEPLWDKEGKTYSLTLNTPIDSEKFNTMAL
jgi:hypothetical protein